MIKITLLSGLKHEERYFQNDSIVIGRLPQSMHEIKPDFFLDSLDVQNIHVKIEKTPSGYFAFNVANDPFTTINGRSFGKKNIVSGDSIEIGSSLLKFDIVKEDEDSKIESKADTEDLFSKIEALEAFFASASEEEQKKLHSQENPDQKSEEPLNPLENENLSLEGVISPEDEDKKT